MVVGDPLVGRLVAGKFLVERLIGEGAMGAVYQAHQTALDRRVAIKVMRGALAADPTYAERFHREARAVSRIDHPNIIRVFDFGQEPDGLLYIAMEFLDGRDLFSVLAEEWPFEHVRIVDLLCQALSALAEAHDAGVMHRDLKPENIVVLRRRAEDGTTAEVVKVCDFGIAKIVGDGGEGKPMSGRALTTAGLVVGTPGYMSPEQARGGAFDARSDVYALGVVLYQLLTGRLPFDGDTPLDIVVKAIHEEAPAPSSLGPTAAPGLEPICTKAMSKRPEDRYAGAREMRSALRAAPALPRQFIIGRGERPSIASKPTEAGAAVSTAHLAASPPGARRSRALQAGGAVAGIGAILALVSFFQSAPATSSLPANPRVAALKVEARHPSTVLLTGDGPAPSASGAIVPEPQLREASHRVGHEERAPVTILTAVVAPPAPPPSPTVAAASPAPEPVAPPPPMAAPTSPAPVAIPAPAPSPPPLNPASARVEVGTARSNNAAATGGDVGRAIGPLATRMTACYRAALEGGAGAPGEAPATLHVESDDQGYVTSARVTGAVPPGAARCIEALVTTNVRIDVDTGTANADVTLTFKVQSP